MGFGFFAGERVFSSSFQEECETACTGTLWDVISHEVSRTAQLGSCCRAVGEERRQTSPPLCNPCRAIDLFEGNSDKELRHSCAPPSSSAVHCA